MSIDLQNIGSYVIQGASQGPTRPSDGEIYPFGTKAVQGAVKQPGSLGKLAALSLVSPLEELAAAALLTGSEVGRFVRPTQLISKHGAKWRWTSFLNDEVMPDVLGRSDKPFSFLDCFGGTGIITYMIAAGDWSDDLSKLYYNDYGDETANMFRQVKANPEGVKAEIKRIMETPEIRDHLFDGGFTMIKGMSMFASSHVVQAAAYILRMKLSFGGMGTDVSRRHDANGYQIVLTKAMNTIKAVDDWSMVLQNAVLWKKHFRDAIREFNEKETGVNRIVFLDPPYLGCEGGDKYEVQMPESEHAELAKIIRERKATYIVTHLDNPEYRKIYGDADAEWTVMARYTVDRAGADKKEVTAVWYAK